MARTKALDTIAGVCITTPNHTLFYLQEKDDGHPIPAFRCKYTFFGGKAEHGENSYEAARRELKEELSPDAAAKIIPCLTLLFTFKLQRIYLLPKKEYCSVHLYEAILSESDLTAIAQLPIYEGKRGVLISRNDFSASLFPEHMHSLVKKYESFWRSFS
jgi:8-oxo-dGTP pyrophosphatase MutT (NUDIX family)